MVSFFPVCCPSEKTEYQAFPEGDGVVAFYDCTPAGGISRRFKVKKQENGSKN
jgi:hypothetical protein